MLGIREALLFLAVVVVAVPLFKRLGLGSVLGYLVAGALIGPHGLRLIPDVEAAAHLAETGVVLLLFLIGLELQPERLWELRKRVFGVGAAHVALSGAVLAVAGLALGLSAQAAFVAGIGLSLSSTAFALHQLIADQFAAQRSCVFVITCNDFVDLLFAISFIRLESFDDMA